MIRLILVRHGNTFESHETPIQVGSQTDIPLTSRGKEQAAQVLRYLVRENIAPKTIYSGSLKRQIETSTILADSKTPTEKTSALTEIDYGLWEGLSLEAIQSQWEKEHEAWILQGKWPDSIFGGSLERHLQEIAKWLAHLRKTYASTETVVGVTSNGIIRLFHPNRQERGDLKVKTGHFCELHLYPDTVLVKSWNQSPSLAF